MSRHIKIKILEHLDSKIVDEKDYTSYYAALSTYGLKFSRAVHPLAANASYQAVTTEFISDPLLTIFIDRDEDVDAGMTVKLNGNDTAFGVQPIFAIEEEITSLQVNNNNTAKNLEVIQLVQMNRDFATNELTGVVATTSVDVDLITGPITDTTYSVLASDRFIILDATTNNQAVTLPDATENTGRIIRFIRVDSSGNTVTLETYLSQTINGNPNYEMIVTNEVVELISDGSNWVIIGVVS